MPAPPKARTRDQIWIFLVDAAESMEVCYYWFNLNDAPDHMYDQIANNLTKNVWRYDNVRDGDGIEGFEGIVDQDGEDAEMRAEEVMRYTRTRWCQAPSHRTQAKPHQALMSSFLWFRFRGLGTPNDPVWAPGTATPPQYTPRDSH